MSLEQSVFYQPHADRPVAREVLFSTGKVVLMKIAERDRLMIRSALQTADAVSRGRGAIHLVSLTGRRVVGCAIRPFAEEAQYP
jgi:hypothetical protein